jgi:hypothetical protein
LKRSPVAEISRDEMEARLETVEARADARFNEIMGEVRASNATLHGEMKGFHGELAAFRGELHAFDSRIGNVADNTKGLRGFIASTAIAVVAVVLAAWAVLWAVFGVGMDAGNVADAAAQRAVERVLKATPSRPAP